MNGAPTYHDVRVSTSTGLDGARIFDLPYDVVLYCRRTTGWELRNGETLLGGEYEGSKWIVVEIEGTIIVDSRGREDEDGDES